MSDSIRIGTRESELAVWQATEVLNKITSKGQKAELVFIKSEGDKDLITPLYEIGVQGIFTRTLDAALLNDRIDIAVHSMKDVPVTLPKGLVQAAVLPRGPVHDLLVYKQEYVSVQNDIAFLRMRPCVATSSIRRIAQWLHRYPTHSTTNLRGNINTRLKKMQSEDWDGAIFAQAGLDRINVRPQNSVVLDWMIPAPAQGAIMVVCRNDDKRTFELCREFNDEHTDICTRVERDFLKSLLGGCATPIAAMANIENNNIQFRGNVLSPDGTEKVEIDGVIPKHLYSTAGADLAKQILEKGANKIIEGFSHVES